MANISKPTVTLSSGFHMPVIGLGTSFSTTFEAPDPIEVENTVRVALQLGYRHIDCAPVYQNEASITSKLWNTEHDPKDVESALDQTLQDLGTEYIHWPQSYVKITPYTLFPEDENGNSMTIDIPLAYIWQAMEAFVATGKARSIGVGSFFQPQIEELLLN
ncbi:hypothetical protein IFR05_013451 [Cadophora sp. M221]|nr:hypothetical protein IFR05_013451 [Cadophora sp. M221]